MNQIKWWKNVCSQCISQPSWSLVLITKILLEICVNNDFLQEQPNAQPTPIQILHEQLLLYSVMYNDTYKNQ